MHFTDNTEKETSLFVLELLDKVKFLPITLLKYRRHSEATSCTNLSNNRSLYIKIKTRFVFLYKLASFLLSQSYAR